MKSTNVKAMVAKMFTVGLLAAAVVMAAPTKAQAQVAVGVRIGQGAYYAPEYRRQYAAPAVGFYGYAPVYYGQRYDFERREAFARHEAWEHRFDRRDDRRFDHR